MPRIIVVGAALLMLSTGLASGKTLSKASALCVSQGGVFGPPDIPNSYVCNTSTTFTSAQYAEASALCTRYYRGIFDSSTLNNYYACYLPVKRPHSPVGDPAKG